MFRYLKYCGINPLGESNLARERDIYVQIDRYIYIYRYIVRQMYRQIYKQIDVELNRYKDIKGK